MRFRVSPPRGGHAPARPALGARRRGGPKTTPTSSRAARVRRNPLLLQSTKEKGHVAAGSGFVMLEIRYYSCRIAKVRCYEKFKKARRRPAEFPERDRGRSGGARGGFAARTRSTG